MLRIVKSNKLTYWVELPDGHHVKRRFRNHPLSLGDGPVSTITMPSSFLSRFIDWVMILIGR